MPKINVISAAPLQLLTLLTTSKILYIATVYQSVKKTSPPKKLLWLTGNLETLLTKKADSSIFYLYKYWFMINEKGMKD